MPISTTPTAALRSRPGVSEVYETEAAAKERGKLNQQLQIIQQINQFKKDKEYGNQDI
jgi:hypothetical protein